jgi:hypothetical protein
LQPLQEQASTSFLKKRSKKLLIVEALRWQRRDSSDQSFLVLFFKKELLSYVFDSLGEPSSCSSIKPPRT